MDYKFHVVLSLFFIDDRRLFKGNFFRIPSPPALMFLSNPFNSISLLHTNEQPENRKYLLNRAVNFTNPLTLQGAYK